jgi:hypothetical protein
VRFFTLCRMTDILRLHKSLDTNVEQWLAGLYLRLFFAQDYSHAATFHFGGTFDDGDVG